MTNIGFTGTRKDLSSRQYGKIEKVFSQFDATSTLHHGDCLGADNYAHGLAREQGFKVVVHPPINPNERAFWPSGDAVVVLPEKDYIQRNHDIVDACDVLIACPAQDVEILRSGTWATVRYARKQGVKVILITPTPTLDG